MSDNTQNGEEEPLWWSIFKILAFIIGAIVLIRILFGLLVGLIGFVASLAIPLLIVSAIAYFGYKIFLEDDSDDSVQSSDPALLEYESSDVVLDDEIDPLEAKFAELESRQTGDS